MSWTYTTLKSAIQDYTENTESTFVADLAIIIQQAEDRIVKSVELPNFRKNVTGSFTNGNQYLTAPDDYLYPFSLAVLDSSNNYSYLISTDVSFIREAYPSAASTGVPKHYAQFDDNSFIVGPSPNADLSIIIQQGEDRIVKSVELPNFRKNVTGTFTSGNQYLETPSDYLYPFSLAVLDDSNNYSYLLNTDVSFIREAYPSASTTGTPKHYAQFDDTTFIVGPSPSSNLNAELHYYYVPQSITASADGTSWLGTNASELLLYASLIEAYTFMKGEPDIMANYEKRFQEALQKLTLLSDGYNRKDAYRDGQRKIDV